MKLYKRIKDFWHFIQSHFGLALIFVTFLLTFSTGIVSNKNIEFLLELTSGESHFESSAIFTFILINIASQLIVVAPIELISNLISATFMLGALYLYYSTLLNMGISRNNAQWSLLLFFLCPPIWQLSASVNSQTIFLLLFNTSLYLFSSPKPTFLKISSALISLIFAFTYANFLEVSGIVSPNTQNITGQNAFELLLALFKQAQSHNAFLLYFGMVGLAISAAQCMKKFKSWSDTNHTQRALVVFLCIHTFIASLSIFYFSSTSFSNSGFLLGYAASVLGLATLLESIVTQAHLRIAFLTIMLTGVLSLQAEYKPSVFNEYNKNIQSELNAFLGLVQEPAEIYIEGDSARILEFLYQSRHQAKRITIMNLPKWRWESTFKKNSNSNIYFSELPTFLSHLDVIIIQDFFKLESKSEKDIGSFEIEKSTEHNKIKKRRRTGISWDDPDNIQFKKNLLIKLEGKINPARFSILLDNNDTYRLYYILDNIVYDSSFIDKNTSKQGMTLRDIEVPEQAIKRGFNEVLIEATSGDDRYSIGHLRFRG